MPVKVIVNDASSHIPGLLLFVVISVTNVIFHFCHFCFSLQYISQSWFCSSFSIHSLCQNSFTADCTCSQWVQWLLKTVCYCPKVSIYEGHCQGPRWHMHLLWMLGFVYTFDTCASQQLWLLHHCGKYFGLNRRLKLDLHVDQWASISLVWTPVAGST